MNEEIRSAANAIRKEMDGRIAAIKANPEMAEVLRLQRALNAMEDLIGDQHTTLAQVFGLDAEQQNRPSVRPDEFYGWDQLEAAKVYIKKFKEARLFDEIVAQIKAGGGDVQNEKQLRTALGKSNFDVVKIGDYYGWRENYPQAKRGARGSGVKGSTQTADGDEPEPTDASESEANPGEVQTEKT
jgi:hypothetical protein